MPQACPRCQRTLPDKAAYCHFDGSMLRQGGGPPAGQMLQEFVFPSGKRCRSFDDLASGCYAEWAEARQLLKEGTFASFLAGIGRADLARVAREAMANPDLDIALTSFVGGLPASGAHGPKLNLSPRRLVVGPIRVGEQKPVHLSIQNDGRGLLQGKLTVAEGSEWLSIVEGPDPRSATISATREQSVKLVVNTGALNTNNAYSGKLVAVTNGGVAEVPIRLDLVGRPFARAPYAGANTPQDLARKMRDNPKPAVDFMANGEIARWFASNGWAYPIVGTPAPGLAAVQQYFEELGLARAPQILVAQPEFRLKASPGARLSFQIAISSPARKLVYGRAECSAPWLKLREVSVSGQGQAAFEVEIDTTQMTEDRTYPGVVKVIANAGQTFMVAVQVEMSGNKRGWFSARPAPVAAPPPQPAPTFTAAPPTTHATVPTFTPSPAPLRRPEAPPVPEHADGPRFGIVQAVAAGAILGGLWRLVLLFPADVYARLLGGTAREPAPGSLQSWLLEPSPDDGFLRLFVLATWWAGALAGAFLAWKKGGGGLDLLYGLIAGSVAGLAGAATVGCVLALGDGVPRSLLSSLAAGQPMGSGLATFLWMFLAVVSWIGIGAAAGAALALVGGFGHGLLGMIGAPFAGLLRLAGMARLASLFEAR